MTRWSGSFSISNNAGRSALDVLAKLASVELSALRTLGGAQQIVISPLLPKCEVTWLGASIAGNGGSVSCP